MIRYGLALLLVTVSIGVTNADEPPNAQTKEFLDKYKKLTGEVERAYGTGNYAEAVKKQEAVVELVRSLFPTSKFPKGHAKLADAFSDLGVMNYSAGQLEAALTQYQRALEMRQSLFPEAEFPKGHNDLALSHNTIGMVYSAMGKYELALDHLKRGLTMRERLFPEGNFAVATSLNNVGLLLRDMNRLDEALLHLEKAFSIRQKLYPESKFPDGHPQLANSLNNIALVRESLGKLDAARSYYEQSLAMRRKLYPEARFPNGHPDLSVSLNNIAGLYSAMGQNEKALDYYEQTLALDQRLFSPARYPNGHPSLAATCNNVGYALKQIGRFDEAMARYDEALAIRHKLYPAPRYADGHPDLAVSLSNKGLLLEETGRLDLALQHFEQALAMRRKLFPEGRYPNGHPSLADSLSHMGTVLFAMQRDELALPYLEQALAMTRRLYGSGYPEGHADLARRLANHATFLRAMDKADAALKYAREAYQMFRRLYPASRHPNSHVNLAWSARNLGNMHLQLDQLDEAQTYFNEALAQYRLVYPKEKYPNGHPDLFLSMNSLGAVAFRQAKLTVSLQYSEESEKLLEGLFPAGRYPLGHPKIAANLCNVAVAKAGLGRPEEALAVLERAIAMTEALSERYLTYASEADALAQAESQRQHLHFLLSLAHGNPNRASADYDLVWSIKSNVMRLLSLRHAAARIALTDPKGDARIQSKWQELVSVRHQLGQQIHKAATDAKGRDELLAKLNDRRDQLERELADLMPDLPLLRRRDAEKPAELSRVLPPGTALIDFLRYERSLHEGKGRPTKSVHYLAYLILPGHEPVRVELGSAQTIDESIHRWRSDIAGGRSDARSAAMVRDLVWKPLAGKLPADTRTIYLAVDGDLARLPFAAIPGAKPNTILLEEFTFAVVPHGPFLLGQLKSRRPAAAGATAFLGVGAVDFGESPTGRNAYPPLPGTGAELKQIAAIAGTRRTEVLTGGECTLRRLLEEMPKAAVAHLATHGFFDSKALTRERKRYRDFLHDWQEQSDSQGRIGVGHRSPLAYTGIVLANGNRSTDAVLTGESIVSLPLESLHLVTLSACETGLGEYTGGEGIEGLQRAFHIAGCPNVIASLWKISDNATAALMAKFYHELWVNKQPPLAALRTAQLTIYRHPERIPALAGERGKPDQAKTVELKLELDANAKRKPTTPTKLWAAFVLSGVGK